MFIINGVNITKEGDETMIYGYARVSTAGQQKNGNSLADQKEKLVAAGAEKIYADAFTGTSANRPEFSELLSVIKPFDTLVVTKLDRLGRSVTSVSQIINHLIESEITVNILDLGVITNSPTNTLLRNVLLAFAQFERDMIVERTQEGKAIAKKMNPDFHEGRPRKWDDEQLDNAMNLLKDHSYTQVVKLTGISKSTLIREKKKRGFMQVK